MKTLRRASRLTPSGVRHAAAAYMMLLRAGWRLFVRRETAASWRVSEDAAGRRPLSPEQRGMAVRAARWTNAAARFPFPWARCLQRSLALYLWLEGKGMEPIIRIGVRRAGNAIDAHAWVELDGRVLNDAAKVGEAFTALAPAGTGNEQGDSEGDRQWAE